jgi:hypothetical protein
VKVKVLNIYDEPYKGSYRVPPAEQVESTLREWSYPRLTVNAS